MQAMDAFWYDSGMDEWRETKSGGGEYICEEVPFIGGAEWFIGGG